MKVRSAVRVGWIGVLVMGLALVFGAASAPAAHANSQGTYLKCTIGSTTWLFKQDERLSDCTTGTSSGMIEVWYAGKYMRSFWWSPGHSNTVDFDRAKDLARLGWCSLGMAGVYLYLKAPGWGAGLEIAAKIATRTSTVASLVTKCIAP